MDRKRHCLGWLHSKRVYVLLEWFWKIRQQKKSGGGRCWEEWKGKNTGSSCKITSCFRQLFTTRAAAGVPQNKHGETDFNFKPEQSWMWRDLPHGLPRGEERSCASMALVLLEELLQESGPSKKAPVFLLYCLSNKMQHLRMLSIFSALCFVV